MHGIIFSEMRKFVDLKLGRTGWEDLLGESGLGRRMYLPVQEYPDAELVAIVGCAARALSVSLDEILEDFGRFIAPSLVGMYRTLVQPEWRTLDLLENTEQTIHQVVRARNRGAKPAQLQVVRTAPGAVDLTYRSERRLCAVAKGIIQGVATHYEERVEITEIECMHSGADVCRMEVRLVERPAAKDRVSTRKKGAATKDAAARKGAPKKPSSSRRPRGTTAGR